MNKMKKNEKKKTVNNFSVNNLLDAIYEIRLSNKVNIAKIYASENVYIPEAFHLVQFHYQLLPNS